jgi:hypothetical protein
MIKGGPVPVDKNTTSRIRTYGAFRGLYPLWANVEYRRLLHLRSVEDDTDARINKKHRRCRPYKVTMELLLLPVTLKVCFWLKRIENVDYFDQRFPVNRPRSGLARKGEGISGSPAPALCGALPVWLDGPKMMARFAAKRLIVHQRYLSRPPESLRAQPYMLCKKVSILSSVASTS